ncbi:mucin-19 [Heteronotia binoei]|uniref:mucin-19 n=1 Tax=Heteronotia binoei TaxID=13085 RepID=UPI00292FA122|nr:mucin-19 [Heteronotia binoei]
MNLLMLCFVVSVSVHNKGECACFFKNQDFAVEAVFKDPENPCLTYICTKEGFTTKVEDCPGQSWCSKELRTYDDNGCCYNCMFDCQVAPIQMAISKNGCTGTIKTQMCKGHCKQIVSYDDKTRKIKNDCSCCQGTKYIAKKDRLFCSGGKLKPYRYKQVVSCSCTPCKDA